MFVSARSPRRLEVAKNCGADVTLVVDPAKEEESSIIERIRSAIGDLPNVTIDCSGNEKCITIGINVSTTLRKINEELYENIFSIPVFQNFRLLVDSGMYLQSKNYTFS